MGALSSDALGGWTPLDVSWILKCAMLMMAGISQQRQKSVGYCSTYFQYWPFGTQVRSGAPTHPCSEHRLQTCYWSLHCSLQAWNTWRNSRLFLLGLPEPCLFCQVPSYITSEMHLGVLRSSATFSGTQRLPVGASFSTGDRRVLGTWTSSR